MIINKSSMCFSPCVDDHLRQFGEEHIRVGGLRGIVSLLGGDEESHGEVGLTGRARSSDGLGQYGGRHGHLLSYKGQRYHLEVNQKTRYNDSIVVLMHDL